MNEVEPEVKDALEGLRARTSPVRRAAAKRLRKLKDPEAGPDLLRALCEEVRDPRTWQTQYQMIMALGEAGYRPALPCLRELASRTFDATMVYVAIGDAIVRLGRAYEDDPSPVLALMGTSNRMLIDGAFRAVAMLRLRLTPGAVETIVGHVSALALDDGLRFWVAAAAAGWSGPAVERFLAECAESPRADVRKAAEASRRGTYLSWRPL